MAAQWDGVQLGDLLVAAWIHRARREYDLWREVEKRAAQRALKECAVLVVLIAGHERQICFTVDKSGDSVQFKHAPASLSAEHDPTESQRSEGLNMAKWQWERIKDVANGKGTLIVWDGMKVDMSTLDRPQWESIRMCVPAAHLDVIDSGYCRLGKVTPWDVAVEQVIKHTQLPGMNEDDLKEYAGCVSIGALEAATKVSGAIASLEAKGCAQSIRRQLESELPGEIGEIRSLLKLPSDGDPPKTEEPQSYVTLDEPPPTGTPPKTETPCTLLTNWREITDALGLRHDEQDKAKSLNERYDGPIPKPKRGSQPVVDRDVLIAWWNGLAVQERELANQRRGAELSGESYAHGKSGEVVPEISGEVKRRRRDRKR
jgi:hypothetical protein